MGSPIVLLIAVVSALAGAETSRIEIAGVGIERGQPEQAARAALPQLYCVEVQDADPPMTRCTVSDGQAPDPDGSVTFQDGRVHQASRNWYLARNAGPYDVLLELNRIVRGITGEHPSCAKVETGEQDDSTSTVLVFPDRYVSVTTQDFRGRRIRITESLRVNPLPDRSRAQGTSNRGDRQCVFSTAD